MGMGGARVAELVNLLNEAFAGSGDHGWSHGLLPNLQSVPEAAWRVLPAGGSRSIEAIALHAGATKVMYDDYAFGTQSLSWDQPAVQPWPEGSAPMALTLDWLGEVHARFVAHVSVLTDADLDLPRRANWGEDETTRWLITTMIGHDLYHAGEVNHLRSILGPDDRWAHERDVD